MPKRSSRPASDPNVAAHRLLAKITGEEQPEPLPAPTLSERKQMAAMLGRRGGLKGGKKAAENMTPEQRKARAAKAAAARWAKDGDDRGTTNP